MPVKTEIRLPAEKGEAVKNVSFDVLRRVFALYQTEPHWKMVELTEDEARVVHRLIGQVLEITEEPDPACAMCRVKE